MRRGKTVDFIHLESVGSTIDFAKKHLSSFSCEKMTCISAKRQESGKGRFGREWNSPQGNIYASFVFFWNGDKRFVANIGQLLSLSATEALRGLEFPVKIKWPNDLILDEKKVAGVIVDTAQNKSGLAIIASIGLNVNMSEGLLANIERPATSLSVHSGDIWDVEEVLERLSKRFQVDIDRLETEGFVSMHNRYTKLLLQQDEQITITQGKNQFSGICHGIDEGGRLLLREDNGNLKVFISGETSLRS